MPWDGVLARIGGGRRWFLADDERRASLRLTEAERAGRGWVFARCAEAGGWTLGQTSPRASNPERPGLGLRPRMRQASTLTSDAEESGRYVPSYIEELTGRYCS